METLVAKFKAMDVFEDPAHALLHDVKCILDCYDKGKPTLHGVTFHVTKDMVDDSRKLFYAILSIINDLKGGTNDLLEIMPLIDEYLERF